MAKLWKYCDGTITNLWHRRLAGACAKQIECRGGMGQLVDPCFSPLVAKQNRTRQEAVTRECRGPPDEHPPLPHGRGSDHAHTLRVCPILAPQGWEMVRNRASQISPEKVKFAGICRNLGQSYQRSAISSQLSVVTTRVPLAACPPVRRLRSGRTCWLSCSRAPRFANKEPQRVPLAACLPV